MEDLQGFCAKSVCGVCLSIHSTSHSAPTLSKAGPQVSEHMRGDCKQLVQEWYLHCSRERGQALRGPLSPPVLTGPVSTCDWREQNTGSQFFF